MLSASTGSGPVSPFKEQQQQQQEKARLALLFTQRLTPTLLHTAQLIAGRTPKAWRRLPG